MVDFFQEHGLGANPERAVAIELAIHHVLFAGFGMRGHVFDQVVVALEMLVHAVYLQLLHNASRSCLAI